MITIHSDDLVGLIFADQEELYPQRSAYLRLSKDIDPTFCRYVISKRQADLFVNVPQVHIQTIPVPDAEPIYILWRTEDWLESVTKRYVLVATMRQIREDRMKSSSEESRIYRMAAKLAKFSKTKIEAVIINLSECLKQSGEEQLKNNLTQLGKLINQSIYEAPEAAQGIDQVVQENQPANQQADNQTD